jgi:hypothetical protein
VLLGELNPEGCDEPGMKITFGKINSKFVVSDHFETYSIWKDNIEVNYIHVGSCGVNWAERGSCLLPKIKGGRLGTVVVHVKTKNPT